MIGKSSQRSRGHTWKEVAVVSGVSVPDGAAHRRGNRGHDNARTQVGPIEGRRVSGYLLHGLTEEHDVAVGGMAPLPLAGDD